MSDFPEIPEPSASAFGARFEGREAASWSVIDRVRTRLTLVSPEMLLSILRMVIFLSLVLICYRDTLNNHP